jgi:hypothetical protein
MKLLLAPLFLIILISCNNAKNEKYENNAMVDSSQNQYNPKDTTTQNQIDKKDVSQLPSEISLPDFDTASDIKIAVLKQNGIPQDLWFDTKCTTCNKVCCSPCLQKGVFKFCVKTPNPNCLSCGHASEKHVPSKHIII